MLANVVLILIIGLSGYSWWETRKIEAASEGKGGRRDRSDLMVILFCLYVLIVNYTCR